MRSRLVCLALVAACHPTAPPATPAVAAAAMPPTAPAPAPAPPATKVDLDKVLAMQSRGLYACIVRETATRPDFGGHLDAEVTWDTRGRIVNVQISASTFPDDSVLPCLLRAWRDLRLPPSHEYASGHMRLVWENRCDSSSSKAA
jgi:hypothetical protein